MSGTARRTLAVACPALLAALGLAAPGTTGAALLYPLLGVLPGLVVARLLPIETGPLARLGLGLAAGPLVTSVLGWGLIAAGLPVAIAARAIAAGAILAWTAAWRRPPALPWREAGARFALLWAAGAGALVALPLLLNPWLRIRSDSWTHAGIVFEILERGLPPEDPRFAGLPLNYVWFYNLFLALVAALRGDDPFVLIPFFNAWALAATLLVAWLIGRRLWGIAGARGCAILAGVGFNAGVWLLWPLRLVRALTGNDRGWAEVQRDLETLHLGDVQVIWTLSAPFAFMANFLDKFLIGTAVAYAYLMMHLHLWALVTWLAAPGARPLLWMAAAACGTLLFHGVVGLSYLPVALATFALSALLARTGLPDARRLALPALATLGGALAALPYTLAISRGWSAGRSGLAHRYFAFDPWVLWTLVSAVLIAAWLARGPVRRAFAERQAAPALLVLLALGMAGFAGVVKLPLQNHIKFVYQAFVPIALLGGAALAGEARAWSLRLGRPAAIATLALVFGGPPALTLAGYFADPSGHASPDVHLTSEERRLFAWARAETPPEAVFVDHRFRSVLMVRAGRQLWLGSQHGPELAAFPLDQIRERSAVMADLYGPLDSLERDVRALGALGRPVYVLYRAADFGAGEVPGDRLPPDRFARVYDRDGFVVYHLQPPAASGAFR